MPKDPEHPSPFPTAPYHFPAGLPGAGGMAWSPEFPYWRRKAPEAYNLANGVDACVGMAQEPADEADDADAKMDTDYVADVTVAQGAWDPWPTHD